MNVGGSHKSKDKDLINSPFSKYKDGSRPISVAVQQCKMFREINN